MISVARHIRLPYLFEKYCVRKRHHSARLSIILKFSFLVCLVLRTFIAFEKMVVRRALPNGYIVRSHLSTTALSLSFSCFYLWIFCHSNISKKLKTCSVIHGITFSVFISIRLHIQHKTRTEGKSEKERESDRQRE